MRTKKKVTYLTFGNQDAGVFSSYVTDVCAYMGDKFDPDIRVISFISVRGYFKVRKKRKALYANTAILPMFPKLKYWKWNLITLWFLWPFIGSKKVIALSPIAANLGLKMRQRGWVNTLIYDAEGATSAEWREYDVVQDSYMTHQIHTLEEMAVNKSDHRKTVSSKMRNYWKREFGYTANDEIIVPCTLNSVFIKDMERAEGLKQLRLDWGYTEEDVIFVYAGSTAQWQSFDLVDETFTKLLALNPTYKVLFLAKVNLEDLQCYTGNEGRLKKGWLDFEKVPQVLSMCDYGILLRRPSVTNEVAAPTKFAEYVSCGLKVLISPGIGDYSEFAVDYDCGFLVETGDETFLQSLSGTTYQTKKRLNHLAIRNFTNDNFEKELSKLTTI